MGTSDGVSQSGDGFSVRTGDEPPEQDPEHRARQVAQARVSLLQIWRTVQPAQPVRSVSLALEAAGIALCTVDGGQVVGAGVVVALDERGRVRVTWRYPRGRWPADAGTADLDTAADALGPACWDALLGCPVVPGRAAQVPSGRTGKAVTAIGATS